VVDIKQQREQTARGRAAETLKKNRYRQEWFEGLRRELHAALEGLSLNDLEGLQRVKISLGVLRRLEENMDRDIANGSYAAKVIAGLDKQKESEK
jgi:hypothetical protein